MLEAKNQLGTIILIFITIIVGVALISALGDQIYGNVNLRTITNKSVDISSARNTGSLTVTNQSLDISSARNVSGGFFPPVEVLLGNANLISFSELRMVNGTTFVNGTDYRVNFSAGGVTMLATQKTVDFQSDNITLADYDYTNGLGNFTTPTEIDFSTDELSSFSELRMVNGTTFTENTDYRINLTIGGLTLLDTVKTASFDSDNITLADYSTYPDLYVRQSISRTILNNLILIFVVLGLVVWVYATVRKTWLDQIT